MEEKTKDMPEIEGFDFDNSGTLIKSDTELINKFGRSYEQQANYYGAACAVLPKYDRCIGAFLFLAYFGAFGRLFMVRRSVSVRMTLFSKTGSMKGSISFLFPHLADPYSTPCRNFFAFLER